jgi:hypothetical protein
MHLKAYKFRIYPSKDQEVLLAKTFGCCRFVWNKLVENFNSNSKEFINEKILKDTPEFEFLLPLFKENDWFLTSSRNSSLTRNERLNSEDPDSRKSLIGSPLVCLIKSSS